jgi:hypothetical protein
VSEPWIDPRQDLESVPPNPLEDDVALIRIIEVGQEGQIGGMSRLPPSRIRLVRLPNRPEVDRSGVWQTPLLGELTLLSREEINGFEVLSVSEATALAKLVDANAFPFKLVLVHGSDSFRDGRCLTSPGRWDTPTGLPKARMSVWIRSLIPLKSIW